MSFSTRNGDVERVSRVSAWGSSRCTFTLPRFGRGTRCRRLSSISPRLPNTIKLRQAATTRILSCRLTSSFCIPTGMPVYVTGERQVSHDGSRFSSGSIFLLPFAMASFDRYLNRIQSTFSYLRESNHSPRNHPRYHYHTLNFYTFKISDALRFSDSVYKSYMCGRYCRNLVSNSHVSKSSTHL